MKKLAIIVTAAGLLAGTGSVAFAQAAPYMPAEMDPNEAVLPNDPILEGAGVKVGDGTVIHPLVGIETGVVSNVFYEEAGGSTAGLLRVLIELGTGSLPGQRQTVGTTSNSDGNDGPAETSATISKGALEYTANLFLSYDQYLSTNSDVTAQGGLGGGFLARGTVNPGQTFSFTFLEDFNRIIRSTNFESRGDTNRDLNQLVLQLHYAPPGRNLSGYLFYEDRLDLFETADQRFANRFQNDLGIRVNYQWLPQTRAYVTVSEGVYSGIGATSEKVTSFPLVAVVGLETALTVNTTLQARVGYTEGFYSSGPDYATIVGAGQFAWRYNPLGRAVLVYHYDHQDSINANFYGEHMLQAHIEQLFAPFLVFATAEVHYRTYEGLIVTGNTPDRTDVILAASAGLRYGFRRNIAATLDYTFTSDQTDFRYMTGGAGNGIDDPSFTRHELLVGVRATY